MLSNVIKSVRAFFLLIFLAKWLPSWELPCSRYPLKCCSRSGPPKRIGNSTEWKVYSNWQNVIYCVASNVIESILWFWHLFFYWDTVSHPDAEIHFTYQNRMLNVDCWMLNVECPQSTWHWPLCIGYRYTVLHCSSLFHWQFWPIRMAVHIECMCGQPWCWTCYKNGHEYRYQYRHHHHHRMIKWTEWKSKYIFNLRLCSIYLNYLLRICLRVYTTHMHTHAHTHTGQILEMGRLG